MTKSNAIAMAVAATIGAGGLAAGPAHAQNSSACEGWSVSDVDGNGFISMIEIEDYARTQAQSMDKDSSGTVSRDEYVNCAQQADANRSSGAEVDEAQFANLDVNDDGSIHREEYRDSAKAIYDAMGSGDTDAATSAGQFVRSGMNGEAGDASQMSEGEFASRSAETFEGLDTDRDDTLSREEFIEQAPETELSDIYDQQFDTADTDGSGDLTEQELIAVNAERANRAMEKAQKSAQMSGSGDDSMQNDSMQNEEQTADAGTTGEQSDQPTAMGQNGQAGVPVIFFYYEPI